MIDQSTTKPSSNSSVSHIIGGFLPDAFSSSDRTIPGGIDNNSFNDLFSSYGEVMHIEEQKEVMDDTCSSCICSGNEQEVLLYLIRHGEAEHNIEEKRAMEEARRIAVEEEGLDEDDPIVQKRIQEARKAVLNDEMLRDAKLSEQGKREAEVARDKLQQLIQADNGLEKPDYVLVSPLTRTLETCDIIFPDNQNIHVREEITERRTGKPPDTRSSVQWLSLRPSFQRFSMDQLQNAATSSTVKNSKVKKAHLARCSSSIDENKPSNKKTIKRSHSQPEIFLMSDDLFNGADQNDPKFTEEDKEELRARTETLFALLCDANSFSVAVVTHKGYLRELERGPFGNPEATEFQNCEIRTYRIVMRDNKLVRAERIKIMDQ